ncbi:MAG: phosphoglucomutase/phosphomannomutase family protein, partial [Dehalococcoidia bacterium]
YFERIDIEFPSEEREGIIHRLAKSRPGQIDNLKLEKMDTSDGFRFLLANGTWLLVRFSGTEPILRIYAESDSPKRVQRLLAEGRKIVGI